MNKVTKDAQRDAHEAARAQMYYGEGAGTRRNLIATTVDYKFRVVPGYAEAYNAALLNEDMSKHAKKARSERKQRDVLKSVDKNVRAIRTGNTHNTTNNVALVLVLAYAAHRSGYDKKALEFVQDKTQKVKVWAADAKKKAEEKKDQADLDARRAS